MGQIFGKKEKIPKHNPKSSTSNLGCERYDINKKSQTINKKHEYKEGNSKHYSIIEHNRS